MFGIELQEILRIVSLKTSKVKIDIHLEADDFTGINDELYTWLISRLRETHEFIDEFNTLTQAGIDFFSDDTNKNNLSLSKRFESKDVFEIVNKSLNS